MLQSATRAFIALLLAGLIVAAWLALDGGAGEGAAPAQQQTRDIQGDALQLIVGRGVVRDGGLAITGYRRQEGREHAVAIWRGALQARDYDLLRYDIQAAPATRLNLTWRRADDPATVHSRPLARATLGAAVVTLEEEADWRGTIVEVGVYATAARGDQGLFVSSLEFAAADAAGRLEAHWASWSGFRGWDYTSINTLHGTLQEKDLSPLPVAAAWAALASLLLFGWGLLRRRQLPGAYLAAWLVPWVALDLLWQAELQNQLAEVRDRFGGKTMHEKHLADDDAYIYRYIMRLKRDVLPQQPVRLVIAHDSRGHNLERLKAQYYLLPHNVFNFGAGPSRRGYARGDYILLLEDTTDPAYHPERGKLIWRRGLQMHAELVDSDPMGRLFRVTRRPWGGRES